MGNKQVKKQRAGIYAFLEQTKVLESDDEATIHTARQMYWKTYKAAWRKKQRSETRAFTVLYSLSEAKQVIACAREHRRSPVQFIKEACLNGYMRKQYIIPDKEAVDEIRQLLAVTHNALLKLFDENLLPFEIGRRVLMQIQELEDNVLRELSHPKER